MMNDKLLDLAALEQLDLEHQEKENSLKLLTNLLGVNTMTFTMLDHGVEKGSLTPDKWEELTKIHLKLESKLKKTIARLEKDSGGRFLTEKSAEKFRKTVRKYLKTIDEIRANL